MSGPQRLGGRRADKPAGPPGRWLVSIPAWGPRYIEVATRYTIPALLIALQQIPRRATILIWTDMPDKFVIDPAVADVQFLPVPGPDNAFESLSNCHREILRVAQQAERVLLLTSDMVVSKEVIATCDRLLSAWANLVCCVAPRALESANPPIGVTGRELLGWAWDNRHPMTQDCTWPDGRSYDVWRMYFEKDGEVAARAFLPHPLACIPFRRRIRFSPTIDVNLNWNFSPGESYLITAPEEGAAVEISPREKDYLKTTTMRERVESVDLQPSTPAMVKCTNQRHRMFWGKRVIFRGQGGDCGDEAMVRRILK